MNTGEFNKFFGAATSALLVFLLAGFFAEELYHLEEPEELAYALEIEAPEGAAEPEPEVDFASLLQTASAQAGEQVFRKCSACHAVEDGRNGVGPHLYDVVGRPIDAVAGYDYSGALEEQGDAWSFDNLNHFLENPQGWAPGTKMGFAGLPKPEDRAAVIVYLNEIGGSPEPLPEPAAAPVEEAAAPAEGEGEAVAPQDQAGVVQTDPTEAGAAEAELAETVGAADGAMEGETTSEVSQAMSMANAEVNENETPGETEATLEPATRGAPPPPAPEAERSAPEAEAGAAEDEARTAAAGTEDDASGAAVEAPAMTEAAGEDVASEGTEVAQAPAAVGAGQAAAQAPAEGGADQAAAPAPAEGGGESAGGDAELEALEAALAAALIDDDALYRQECGLCHSLEEETHGIGPSLHGVIGREIAAAPYYTYSEELAALDGRWSVRRLDEYLGAGAEAPGGHGGYAGAPTVATRAAVLAYVHEQTGGGGPLTAEAGENLAKAGETAVAAVEQAAEDAGAVVDDAAEATAETAGEAVDAAEDGAATALETVEESAATALETVEEDAAAVAEAVGDGLAAAGAAVGEAVTEAGDAIEGAADDVGEAGESAVMQTGEAVESAGRALSEASGAEPVEIEGEEPAPQQAEAAPVGTDQAVTGQSGAAASREESAPAAEPAAQEAGSPAEAPAAGGASAFAAAVAAADASAGQRIWRQCQACHRLEDGANAVGPHLHALIGRPIASVEGYSYSDALQAKSGEVWDWDALDGWLENPREWAPGNKMTYRGLRDMEDRAAVVKYINEEGGDPQPYP